MPTKKKKKETFRLCLVLFSQNRDNNNRCHWAQIQMKAGDSVPSPQACVYFISVTSLTTGPVLGLSKTHRVLLAARAPALKGFTRPVGTSRSSFIRHTCDLIKSASTRPC